MSSAITRLTEEHFWKKVKRRDWVDDTYPLYFVPLAFTSLGDMRGENDLGASVIYGVEGDWELYREPSQRVREMAANLHRIIVAAMLRHRNDCDILTSAEFYVEIIAPFLERVILNERRLQTDRILALIRDGDKHTEDSVDVNGP